MKLKYKIIPRGAANGQVPLNWVFLDKKDIDAAGLTHLDAVRLIANEMGTDCAAVDIMDMEGVTCTSDGIIAPGAVCGVASVDHRMINREFGYLNVSPIPFTEKMLEEETHMKLWLTEPYHGRTIYKGPSTADRGARASHNENMTMTGRICNNNVGSEVMNMLEMTEILAPYFGIYQLMTGGDVYIGKAGPIVSVGIGMIVSERHGRIFGSDNLGAYKAGMTAHNSGKYAKTVKSDYPAIVAPKSVLAEYTLRALDIGLVPGLDIGCSPACIELARAYGKPVAVDNISDRAWEELESIGFTKDYVTSPRDVLTREEIIKYADEIIPGMDGAKHYAASEIIQDQELTW
ncbi:MAG: hypothetical protein PUC44_07290 [Eubacteriales bacterium]|nr:hypothetical protein [Eubacteriales bacterium]